MLDNEALVIKIKDKKIVIKPFTFIISILFVYLIVLVITGVSDWTNSKITNQSNYDKVYRFMGTVEIVNDEYCTVKITDVGNTDLDENDIIELEPYLLATNRKFNFALSDSRDVIIFRNSINDKGKVRRNKPYIVTTSGLPKLEKGNSIIVSLSNRLDSDLNERVIPLSVEKYIDISDGFV